MKQKQWIALFGMVSVALILAACDGDSGNNGTEVEGGNSSSAEISLSSGQINSSSVVKSSSSSVKGSSSSVVVSSSSAKVQSSSSTGTLSSSLLAVSSSSAKAAWYYLNSSFTYGEMTDLRDGQTYKTVVIGTQTWIAENLNYADDTAMPNLKGNSWCYLNSADSCAKYGRLYTWTGAMNIDSSYQSTTVSAVISTPQQGVCPAGWHIPTNAEWTTLETAVGDNSGTTGTTLKSRIGWSDSGNGTDIYGFSALSGGEHFGSGFISLGNYGYWWTATECSSTLAYPRLMDYISPFVYMFSKDKAYGLSLRCLKD